MARGRFSLMVESGLVETYFIFVTIYLINYVAIELLIEYRI